MKKISIKTTAIILAFLACQAQAQTKRIKVYFTKPADYSFSSGVNANVSTKIFDTLASYINRAKYTIDVCMYEYETWSGDPIYTALNNAYSRGVKIRYIQDGSYASQNTGVSALNASIPVVASPTTSAYGICHNKFIVFDENAPDTNTAIVFTGSPDWTQAMQQGDYNNVLYLQSKQLAQAYTSQFNQMWGDTTHGGAFNSANSKFGPYKTATAGTHTFNIGGTEVELYFSPKDGVNNQIVSNINSATVDLYCGMFTFTETTDATDIVNRKTAGIFASAILDKYSSGSYTPYTTTLPTGLGSNFVGYVASNTLYHNKYLIVNPSAPCDDPKVLTGSHNWTSSADTKNDENTLVIHNDTIANVYLQAYAGDFKAISTHSLTATASPCSTGIKNIANAKYITVFPNPFTDIVKINIDNSLNPLSLKVFNQLGVCLFEANNINNETSLNLKDFSNGVYFIIIATANQSYFIKLIK